MKTERLVKALTVSCTILIAAYIPVQSTARKIRTKHSIPKQLAQTPIEETDGGKSSVSTDSLDFCERIRPAIRFYGFDKPVTSNQESFFISNGLDSAVSAMEIQITYSDMKGRQLHRRTVNIDCEIPAGETKRVDIKSWDIQKSFYYTKSVHPKRQATPFNVRIELLSVSCLRDN